LLRQGDRLGGDGSVCRGEVERPCGGGGCRDGDVAGVVEEGGGRVDVRLGGGRAGLRFEDVDCCAAWAAGGGGAGAVVEEGGRGEVVD